MHWSMAASFLGTTAAVAMLHDARWGVHVSGLQQGARLLRAWVCSRTWRRLRVLDESAALLNHLSTASVQEFLVDLEEEFRRGSEASLAGA